ncbi:MAG: hypothetical protein WCC10_04805, partial [Tumebacillaceae bacterium]
TMGYPEWLPIGELAGIVVIFYGVYGRMTSNTKGGTATHGNDGRQADYRIHWEEREEDSRESTYQG